MASQPESRLPQPGRDKRRSFLPASAKFSNLPTRQTTAREDSPSRNDKNGKRLNIGDRICIGGVKYGTLKYLGDTHIAAGIWCGIELDDPDGKHDGQVESRRYFSCRPLCGVFAPIDKIEVVESIEVQSDEIAENLLKRRSLPRPPSTQQKSALPSVRPLSTGSIAQVRQQGEYFKDENEEDPCLAPAKVKTGVIQQKSQIAKISGIPRVGFATSQLKQQDAGSDTDLRYRKDGQQRDIKGIFSNLISGKSQEDVSTERRGSAGEVTEGVKKSLPTPVYRSIKPPSSSSFEAARSTTVPETVKTISAPVLNKAVSNTSEVQDQVTFRQPKPSKLPGASRLPTKFSKLEKPLSAESASPLPEVVGTQGDSVELTKTYESQEVHAVELSKTFDRRNTQNVTFDADVNESCGQNVTFDTGDDVKKTVVDVNKTFDIADKGETVYAEQQPSSALSSSEEGAELTRLLRSDSRPFLNITFDAENHSSSPQSLPDVVSSASVSPVSQSGSEVDRDSQTNGRANTDEASLEILDDEAMWDNTDLEDGLDRENKMSSHHMSANSSGLESSMLSSAVVASTPLPGAKRGKYSEEVDSEGEEYEQTDISGIRDLFPKVEKDNLNTTFCVDSSGTSNNSTEATLEEKDLSLGQRAGGAPGLPVLGKCDLIDTVESQLSGDSRMGDGPGVGEGTFLVEKGITDIEMPVSELEEVQELDKTTVEDIMEKMSQSVVMDLEKALDDGRKPMTDSGIGINRLSLTESGIVELAEKKPMMDSGISDASMTRSQQLELESDHLRLEADLKAGHTKRERPISLISTTSADTGYVPDTDSEAGTLTTNSPLDWMEKHGGPTLTSVKEQDDSYRESFTDDQEHVKQSQMKDSEVDSDIYSDVGTLQGEAGHEESDMDDTQMRIADCEISGLAPLCSDDSSLHVSTAQAVSPSSADNSLLEDDRAEADQVPDSTTRGQGEESSAENTLRDLSDASPDAAGLEMPCEEAVIEGEATAASQGEISMGGLDNTASPSASHDVVQAGEVDVSVNSETSVKEDRDHNESAISVGNSSHQEEASVSKTPAKGKRATTPSKKKSAEKIEHKKPNLKVVRSSLADYIRAPVPTKPKDENVEEAKMKKNVVNKKRADNKKSKVAKSPETSDGKADENSPESKRLRPKVEKEPPKIIKRTPPKSKWDEIMTKMETNKVPKPKPKSEIKSRLETYISASPTTPPKKEKDVKEQKPKPKVMSIPKPDYSKVKSKLSIPSPVVKREQSPGPANKTPASQRRKSPHNGARLSNGNIYLDLSESLDNSMSSAKSSHTDLSIDNTESESPRNSKSRTPRSSISRVSSMKTERPSSVASTLSDASQGSIKARNARNKKGDSPKPETPRPKKYSNVKSSIPPPDQNRNRTIRTPSKTNNHLKGSSHQPDLVANSLRSSSEKEISRLETLCETRTKELNMVKMQLKTNGQAFDAMSCLVKYLTQELDAFSCPILAEKLEKAQDQLREAQNHIVELDGTKARLEQEICELSKAKDEGLQEVAKLQQDIVDLNQGQEQTTSQLKQEHEAAMQAQKEAMETRQAEVMAKAKDHHENVISYMKDCHDRNVSDINLDHQRAIDSLRLSHLEDIEKLRTKHDNQMEELHKQHRDKLEDITHRFETIKVTLGDKVETLRGECEDLRNRAKISEEALFHDTDVRVQLALEPFRNLPAEIESLKLVIEMRNEEVQKLRKQNMELEKQLEELPIAKEKIASLQQKVENLEAIINIKSDHEKQLHEKCQNLMRKYDKESKANKRLSMDYEQLMWKVDQDFGSTESLCRRQLSRSPPRSECSSPDQSRKGLSLITSENDSPARRSHRSTSSMGDDSFERKLKRRSATFLLEEKKSSPSASPQAKRLSPNSFDSTPPQVMSMSAGELSYSVSPGVNSSPENSSFSVSQSMTQSMEQSITDSEIFGDFESSGIVTNGQEISVSLTLPEVEAELEREVFTAVTEEQDRSEVQDKLESDV